MENKERIIKGLPASENRKAYRRDYELLNRLRIYKRRKAYYQKHRGEILKKQRVRRLRDVQHSRELGRHRYAQNPEYFKERSRLYRLRNIEACRKAERERAAMERLLHPERVKEKQRRYVLRHREKVLERSRRNAQKYYRLNSDKCKTRSREWSKKHRDYCLRRGRDRYWANPEKYREEARVWRNKHPEQVKMAKRSWNKRNPDKVRSMRKTRYWANRDKAIAATANWVRDKKQTHNLFQALQLQTTLKDYENKNRSKETR